MANEATKKKWRAILKKASLNNESVPAEVFGKYAEVRDPHGVLDLSEECLQDYFACSPDGKMWVWFGDLPAKVCRELLKKHKSKLTSSAGLEKLARASDSFFR
jgi:hypothetical protein